MRPSTSSPLRSFGATDGQAGQAHMRVLAGFQPSGKFHIGNYFGSIRPNIEMQAKSSQSILMIVDLHALTSLKNPAELRENVRDMALDFLACGLDPAKTLLFRQSEVPEHAELLWVLSTLTPMGLMERAVSYKEKVERGLEANVGLFIYPILQTADIVLYDADVVPVGKDQKQHLEMARDIAIKFNNAFGDTFVVPEPMIREDVAVVPGTDGQKMSKSYGNTIPLFGPEDAIKKAVMGIVTDSKGASDPKDPESCVIYGIHKLFLDDKGAKALADEYRGGLAYGEGKKRLLQTCLDFFAPMRARRAELEKTGAVDDILRQGAAKARGIAGGTMERVRKAVGLR